MSIRIENPRFTPEEKERFGLEMVAFTPSVICPRCGEFDDREPVYRHSFTGAPYEQDWIEGHRCLKCGQMYEYRDGNY